MAGKKNTWDDYIYKRSSHILLKTSIFISKVQERTQIIKSESENKQERLTLALPSQSSISPLPKGSHDLLACPCLRASARYLELLLPGKPIISPTKMAENFPSKEMKISMRG